MALAIIKPADRPGKTCAYWLIDELRWDKSTAQTTIGLAGFEDAADRVAAFPVALARARVVVDGAVAGLESAYAAVRAAGGWQDAADC